MFRPFSSRRAAAARRSNRRRYRPGLESYEQRCLLTAGLITVMITEVDTGQSVTIVEGHTPTTTLPGDTSAGLTDNVIYSGPTGSTASPFTDFSIVSETAQSNATASNTTALTQGYLEQAGIIQRSTNTAGVKTLKISVTQSGFGSPTNLTTLGSSSSVTFTNPTSSDSATYGSFANSTASPVVTLTPSSGANPDSESGNAATTALSGIAAPYTLTSVYTVSLGPSTLSSAPTLVSFQSTGLSYVGGVNNLVSGNVYKDLTGNGLTPDDTAFPAPVTVTLAGTTTSGAPLTLTTTDSTAGYYAFTNIPAGTYTVTEAVPSGYVQTGPTSLSYTIPVTPTTISTNNNFDNAIYGSTCIAQLTNISYTLNNGSSTSTVSTLRGSTLEGETVTANFSLAANSTPMTYTLVAYSAPSSSFNASTASQQVITSLATGTFTVGGPYHLTVTLPQSYYQVDFICGAAINTFGPAGSNIFYGSQNRLVDADNGGTNAYAASTLSGVAYVDSNGNGSYGSGDVGLANIPITLTGTTGAGTAVSIPATTSSTGAYSFTGLAPGVYTVTETPPAGYINETANAGSTGGTASVGAISSITLNSNTASVNNNFGEILSNITGTVYYDATGVGLTTANQPPAGSGDTPEAGVTIQLYGPNGLLATTTTAANGTYSFPGRPFGSYGLAEVVPSGQSQTGPNALVYIYGTSATSPVWANNNFSNYVNCSWAGLTGLSYTVTTPSGKTTTVSQLQGNTGSGDTVTANFTIAAGAAPEMLSLVAYEAPAPYYSASNVSQQVITSVAVGTFGPGAHSLTVVEPNSYYQIDFVCGAPLGQLEANGSHVDYQYENRLISYDNGGSQAYYSSVSGTVDRDVTGNGVSKDDVPLAGVTLTLTGVTALGATITPQTTTSASNGTYAFTGLPAGTYVVTQTVPTGDTQTSPPTTYTVNTANTQNSTGNNFDDYVPTNSSCVTNVCYVVTHNGCTSYYPALGGHVSPGDNVSVCFTVTGNAPAPVSLVSYCAPDANAWDDFLSSESTGSFAPGNHTVSLTAPTTNAQVWFVAGSPIDQFGAPGSNIDYQSQSRSLSYAVTTPGTTGTKSTATSFNAIDADVNSPGQPGSLSYTAAGVYTVQGGGSDIWNNSDQFNYAYQTLTGNGELIARVTGLSNTDPWAKAGVMIRSSLDPSSPQAMVAVTPGNGTVFQDRETQGAGSNWLGSVSSSTSTPEWVKIVRNGSQVTGYASTNGVNWTLVGTDTIALGATAYIGLEVTAHNNGSLATATFDNVGTNGYWGDAAGQNLIDSLNGGPNATQLSYVLSSFLPTLYGSSAGADNLTGATNATVASMVQSFGSTGDWLDYDLLANALELYVTNYQLAGNTASSFGFNVTWNGYECEYINAGASGTAIGVANNSYLCVWSILWNIGNRSNNGVIFNGNSALITSVQPLLDGMLENGYNGS